MAKERELIDKPKPNLSPPIQNGNPKVKKPPQLELELLIVRNDIRK